MVNHKNKDPKNYYYILGLQITASAEEIKAAYRRKAMEYHPDRNKSDDATEKFKLIQEAYNVLSNPEKKAQYDVSGIATEEPKQSNSQKKDFDPILCTCCNKLTAQPRYIIFYEVKSFILFTTRSTIQNIFCADCADKKALKASLITWILGWWGVPWGFLYSIHAIFTNLFGGEMPYDINARLLTHQAIYFGLNGNLAMAKAIALDALNFANKGSKDPKILETIKHILDNTGDKNKSNRLKNAWQLTRRPFYIQGGIITAIFIIIFCLSASNNGNSGYYNHNNYSSSYYSNNYRYNNSNSNIQNNRYEYKNPKYVKPTEAPNGLPWPDHAGYVAGYPFLNTDGLSEITVDNSQNDSDVFVKLMSLINSKPKEVRDFYIPAYSSFTVKNIKAGEYDIRYRDLTTGQLYKTQQLQLSERPTYDGTLYSTYKMTLYKVVNGNMRTYDIDESDFDMADTG